MSLIVTTPPTAEPVTVEEVKQRLRLVSTADDTAIGKLITAAREYAEKTTRRSLCPKSYVWSVNHFPPPYAPMRLPAPPLVSIASIKYVDQTETWQTWDPSEYFVASRQEPALVSGKSGIIYPATAPVGGAVEVAFTAGFGATDNTGAQLTQPCPAHLAEAILKLAIHLYEHPEAINGETYREMPVGFSEFFNANKIYTF